ncbi:hypothetical protein BH20ACT3_BH20ACT3_00860 [soil metagenome]
MANVITGLTDDDIETTWREPIAGGGGDDDASDTSDDDASDSDADQSDS